MQAIPGPREQPAPKESWFLLPLRKAMPCLIGPTGTPTAVFPRGFMGLKLLSISHTEQLFSGPP